MEVRTADVTAIPAGNIRVPRDEFAAVWRATSALDAARAERGVTDWYAGAVASTCRWLGTAPTRSKQGPGRLTRSPATKRARLAYEELIDIAEHEPGWCDGVRATLRWAWRRNGPPPVDVSAPTVCDRASTDAHR